MRQLYSMNSGITVSFRPLTGNGIFNIKDLLNYAASMVMVSVPSRGTGFLIFYWRLSLY